MSAPLTRRPVLVGGGIVGVGLGALLDVLVFHLILQWHHLLSGIYSPTTLAGLKTNIYFDGIFALIMVGVMLGGGAILWRAVNQAPRPYSPLRISGSILVGMGAFNLFDGIVDHYVLHAHNVVQGTPALNPHWIGASLLLLGLGLLVLTG